MRAETAEAETAVARQEAASAAAREKEVTDDIERLLRNRSEVQKHHNPSYFHIHSSGTYTHVLQVTSLREEMQRAMAGANQKLMAGAGAAPVLGNAALAETPEPSGYYFTATH